MSDGSERPDARSDDKKRRTLGMDRPITRREFIDGILIGAGAITASGWLEACTSSEGSGTSSSAGAAPTGSSGAPGSAAYPPSLTGLRGTTLSESSVMHSLRDGAPWDYLGSPSDLGESYDLIVVGGGISGLASAFFYQQEHGTDARILIVDPLDDFGGHARRNEFAASNGRKLIGWGGSGNLDGPAHFSPVVLQMLDDVGVHYKQFYDYGDQALYSNLGLKNAIYFEEEAWGRSSLAMKNQSAKEMLKDAPMAEQAKRDLATLMESPPDYLPGLTDEQKKAKLLDLTYLDFLTKYAKVHPDVIKYLFNISSGEWSTGIDLIGSLEAWLEGCPGFDGMGLKWTAKPPYGAAASDVEYWDYTTGKLEYDPILFMFPDGNHGVASALVRRLIPDVLDGSDMPSLTTGTARYDQLDIGGHSVRIRLKSTAVRVEHDGSPDQASQVRVTYARNGALEQVTGANVIFACWHASIPYIAADLPAEQRAALGESFKLPEIVAQVLIRNWEAFTRVGVKQAFMPGSKKWHWLWLLYPVEDVGSYRFPSDPKDPMLVTLWGNPSADEPAATPREAAAAARGRMFGTAFAEYELWIREALAGTVGKGGFDPARDIEAITINRWPHGYAYEYMRPNDRFWPEGPTPEDIGSRPFGRYAFANSDRAPQAYMHHAIDMAHRAVQELNQ